MLKTQQGIDLEQIRKGFEMFDVDQTGKISPSELLEAYDAMNLKDKNPFIYNLISSLSEDQEEVSIDELISYIDEKLNDNQSQEGLNLIYNSLCQPNNETLTFSTLPQIAKESEDKLTEKELRYLIERAQIGGDEINFEEFFQIVKENNENDTSNGKNISLQLSSGGKTSQQQVYRKKASNKPTNEYNKVNNLNNKKNAKNENIVKNSEDKSSLYDIDDLSEKRSNKKQRINSNSNSNIKSNLNDNNFRKSDIEKSYKENKVEKSKDEIYDNKSYNSSSKKMNKQNNEKEKEKEIKENGNTHKSLKKESEDEEEENGMESINQSINKYLEKKIENESIKNKKIHQSKKEKDNEIEIAEKELNLNLNINNIDIEENDNGKILKNKNITKEPEKKNTQSILNKVDEMETKSIKTTQSIKSTKSKKDEEKIIPQKIQQQNNIINKDKQNKENKDKENKDMKRNEIKAKYQLKKKNEQKKKMKED